MVERQRAVDDLARGSLEDAQPGRIVSGGSTTVVGVSELVFIDVALTAAHNVTPPAAVDNALLIWTFNQDATGGHAVTWPGTFAQQYFVGQTASRSTVVAFRKTVGPLYNLIWTGPANRINA